MTFIFVVLALLCLGTAISSFYQVSIATGWYFLLMAGLNLLLARVS